MYQFSMNEKNEDILHLLKSAFFFLSSDTPMFHIYFKRFFNNFISLLLQSESSSRCCVCVCSCSETFAVIKPPRLQPSRSSVLFLLGRVRNTGLPKTPKIMGADTITARGEGGGWATLSKEKREELWRISHHICTNVLARPVESSLSSLITLQ